MCVVKFPKLNEEGLGILKFWKNANGFDIILDEKFT